MHDHVLHREEHRDVQGRRKTCEGGCRLRTGPRDRPLQRHAHEEAPAKGLRDGRGMGEGYLWVAYLYHGVDFLQAAAFHV